MNIVIAGAGDVGFHLTELLSNEEQNITLIDLDEKMLDYPESHLDILAIKGDVTSLSTLQDAGVGGAHLFVAVTTSDTANLLATILAKRLGAKKTIARVGKVEYMEDQNQEYFRTMGVDHLVSPRILAAQEIERLLHKSSVTDSFEFDNGLISILGFSVDHGSTLLYRTFREIEEIQNDKGIKTICILRNGETLLPTPDTRIERNDHVYLVTNHRDINKVNDLMGKTIKDIKKVMIIGGGPLALLTAKFLEAQFKVTMIVKDEDRCKQLLEYLDKTLIVNGDYTNITLLKDEGLAQMDAFVALTTNSETNIINCITAEQAGVYKTIALVDNAAYTHISQNIGVDTLIDKKLIAANNIFRYVRKGKIEAIASLHGVTGEIIEFEITKSNKLIQQPIGRLHLPEHGARIIGVVRGDEGIIPDAEFVLSRGDKVIVFVLPACVKKVENIFR